MGNYPFQRSLPVPHSIFLVDDDVNSAFLLKRDLHRAFAHADIRQIPSCAALHIIGLSAPDLLVSAYRLNGITGAELVAQIRQAGGCFPIVMITSMPSYRARALEAGANIVLDFEDAKQIEARLQMLEETPQAREPIKHH